METNGFESLRRCRDKPILMIGDLTFQAVRVVFFIIIIYLNIIVVYI